MRRPPVFADAEINLQGNREAELLPHRFHLVFHQPLRFVQIVIRYFENEFVVDLQNHLYVRQVPVESSVHVDHGHFDQVRRRALDGTVDSHPLAEAALCRIVALQFGNGSAATQNGRGVALFPPLGDVAVHQRAHGGKFLEEGVDVVFGLGLRNADVLRQAEGADAVDDAEDDGFGGASHLSGDLAGRPVEDLHGRRHVDVFPFGEDGEQAGILRQVSENTRFDLAVVGAEQVMAFGGDEGLADAETVLAFDGNILQVGIGGGESPRGRDGLVERGMQPFGFRMDQFGQSVHIGGLEFAQTAVIEDLGR